MPQNTPRGYTYPCFSDPANFPAQLQDLAQDVDADVQAILDNMVDARNDPPGVRARGSAVVALAANVNTQLTFDTEDYDNTGMITVPSATFIAPVEGLYLCSFNCTFSGPNNGVRYVLLSVNGFVRCQQARRRAGTSTQITVQASMLSFVGAGQTIRFFVGSSVATTATMYTAQISRMTGTTAL